MAKAKKEEKKPPYRPLKYGEEMERINIRVPKSKKKSVLKLVYDYLKKFEV
jgi:hypothetical protein